MINCIELKDTAWPIKVEQKTNGLFCVTYGLQKKAGLTYAAAAAEFGRCVFHALACEGKLDNEVR